MKVPASKNRPTGFTADLDDRGRRGCVRMRALLVSLKPLIAIERGTPLTYYATGVVYP